MRTLGLDVGDRRIGVAMSDPEGILASPIKIIDRTDEARDIAAIKNIVGEHQVGRIIAGLPRKMDGGIGEQAAKVQAFVERLSGEVDVPVEFRDERLTTVAAHRLMREAQTKKAGRKARDDAFAAAVILQGYLDEE